MSNTFRNYKSIPTIILSIIIIATIPLVIYSVINTNLDFRKEAYEKKTDHCTIILPHVNPKTIAIDKTYQMIVSASFQGETINEVKIEDDTKEELFSKLYTEPQSEISEAFTFQPTRKGSKELQGSLKTQENIYPCKMDFDRIIVQENNHPPAFLTNPYIESTSKKKAIKPGEEYSYRLKAVDQDADNIQYHYSFTPSADWLHKNVISGGRDGQLEIEFSGIPQETGTYLANIFIHDGYNRHLRSQSWIIEVNPEGKKIEEIEERVVREPDIAGEIDNKIQLEEPTIGDVSPIDNTSVRIPNPTISANLNASTNADIEKESIKFKLNDEDIKEDSNILKISPEEMIITYTPEKELEDGEYKASVYFEDSRGEKEERSWTFTIETIKDEATLLGIPLSNIIIIIFGFILILLALFIPWILYIAWRRNLDYSFEENEIPEVEESKSLDELLGEEEAEE